MLFLTIVTSALNWNSTVTGTLSESCDQSDTGMNSSIFKDLVQSLHVPFSLTVDITALS